ncbi:MAG: hypothetical protein AAGA03_08285 [Planctomycetota bacterium]
MYRKLSHRLRRLALVCLVSAGGWSTSLTTATAFETSDWEFCETSPAEAFTPLHLARTPGFDSATRVRRPAADERSDADARSITSSLSTDLHRLLHHVAGDGTAFSLLVDSAANQAPVIAETVESIPSPDQASLGTHDTFPARWQQPGDRQPRESSAEPTVPSTNRSIAAAVAAVASKTASHFGVNVQQLIEPFAMVRTGKSSSLEDVVALHQWWQPVPETSPNYESIPHDDASLDVVSLSGGMVSTLSGSRQPHSTRERTGGEQLPVDWTHRSDERFDLVTTEDLIRHQLESIALMEPYDVEHYGPSDSVDIDPGQVAAALKTAWYKRRFLGTSAMIITLDEDYMPYDMEASDQRVWSLFPLTSKPFCLRPQVNCVDGDPMWSESATETAPDPESEIASAEAWKRFSSRAMATWTWLTDRREWVSPLHLGGQWAELSSQLDQAVSQAAVSSGQWLASGRQPNGAAPKPAQPNAVRALLARADATEGLPVIEAQDADRNVPWLQTVSRVGRQAWAWIESEAQRPVTRMASLPRSTPN